jgi:hypothetical protein
MYILSTIIFAIHKVFYETKNGQTEAPKSKSARNPYTDADFPRGKRCDSRCNTTLKTDKIGVDAESVAIRCGV